MSSRFLGSKVSASLGHRNTIVLVHNLIRSRLLLKMAGWSYEVAHEGIGKTGVYNENMHGDEYVAEVDGSTQSDHGPGGPGPGGWGVYLEGLGIKVEAYGPIPHTTNNLAEYKALEEVIRLAGCLGLKKLTVKTDSQLVRNQFEGAWDAEDPDIVEVLERVRREVQEKGMQVSVEWIPREQNARAHALSREGLKLALSKRESDSGGTKE